MESLTKFQNRKIKHIAIKIAVIVGAAAFTWGGVALILVSEIFEPPKTPEDFVYIKLSPEEELKIERAFAQEKLENPPLVWTLPK